MGVSKKKLDQLRDAYDSMLEEFGRKLDNNVFDSQDVHRKVVYASENSIAMIGKGKTGENTKVIDDTFHKTIVHVDGKFKVDFEDGTSKEFTADDTHLEIEPMKNYTAKSLSDNAVTFIVLRKKQNE